MTDYHRLMDYDENRGQIFYSLVARGQVILAEYSICAGNFPAITRVVLSKLVYPEQDKVRRTYKYDTYMFHYIVDDSITYMCLAEHSDSAAFVFLDKVAVKFKNRFPSNSVDLLSSVPLSLNKKFQHALRSEIERFNLSLKREDKRQEMVKKVKKNLEDAKAVVVDNIEKILERGEKIDLLVDKTGQMQQTAHVFESSATRLRNAMWWDNAKRWIMLFGLVCFVIFFLFASYCGGLTFEDCRS